MSGGKARALGEISDALLDPEEAGRMDVPLTAADLINQIRNHYAERTGKAESQAFQLGYRTGAQAVYREVFGNWPPREASVDEMAQACRRKVHAAALEVACSVARQLYGQAGRTVRNAEDLVALVRARTEFEVREATGETVHEGTTVHTPLRDEGIRRDTLRAVASWISQNWLTDLDFASDDLTTPESLAARLQPELDRRVTDAADDGRLRGARAVYRQVTGKPTPAAGTTFGEVVEALAEHVGQLETEAENRGLTTAALHIQRAVCGPWNNDFKWEDQQTWTEIVTTLTDRQRQSELHVLQKLHNHVFGPGPDGERQDILPADTTVASYAEGLLAEAKTTERRNRHETIQEISDELIRAKFWRDANDEPLMGPIAVDPGMTVTTFAGNIHGQRDRTLRHRNRKNISYVLTGLGAGDRYEYINNWSGVLQVIGELVTDQITAAVADVTNAAGAVRQERERVVRYIQQQVFGDIHAITAAPTEAVLIANLKAAVARPPATVLGWSRANHRYIELRRRYTVDHDRAEHTAEDFTDAVLALLLGDGQKVSTTQTAPDGSEHVHSRGPEALWTFGTNGELQWARQHAAVEAAALLMCAAETWPDGQ